METAHLKPRATEGEVRFLRSSYLLLKGTFYLVKKVLLREAENVRQQTGRDLDCLLKDYEQQLKHEFRHPKQWEILFPPSGKTNLENWDISLLTGVLLIVFRHSLPGADRTAIRNIKYQRNEVYAHCKEASLDEIDYTDTCNYLKDAFNILASGCSDAVKQECDAIIQTCLNGALDCKSHVELLIQLAEKDNMLVEIIAKIKPIELREQVLKALQQALQGQRRIEVKVVDSHLGICGTDEDQDNIALAENIIVTVLNEGIRRKQTCEKYACIREIIQEILDEITSQTGVKPISAEKGCVIIRFDCCSNEQLFQFIIYMESKDMKERLNKLADSLSRLLNSKEKLQVSFSLSLETLKSILDEITPKVQREYKRVVHIPIQIESVEGIKRVFDLFEGGGLTNNLQKLSVALTEKVGAKINVKPSINMKQLKEALEDLDPVEDPARQTGKAEECRSEEGHKGELYVDAEEGGDESTQINLTDHEEDIYMEREEPKEQSIQEKTSAETSIQKNNAKDESSDESSEENETVVIPSSRVQYRECLFRLQSLVIDVGTDVLRNIFDQSLTGVGLDAFLANEMEDIKYLKQQEVITKAQFKLLYPPGGQPSNIAEFDIILILCLLRHLHFLRFDEFYENSSMSVDVDESVTSIELNICRLCDIMTKIAHTRLAGGFHQSSFHTIKTDIEKVLLELNATVLKPLAHLNERIKRCENKTLDPAAEQRNQKIFNQWTGMQYEYVIPLRIKLPKKKKDFCDINPQSVKKIDMTRRCRNVMEKKQHIKQDVTSVKKYFKSSVARSKLIKTKDIEHEVSKRNEAESTYHQMESEIVLSSRECLFRLQCLVIDVGTDVLRNVFDQRLQSMALNAFLINQRHNLKILEQQRDITKARFNRLNLSGRQPSIAEFDVSLILLLLRYLPSLSLHEACKYFSLPMRTVVSIDTDLCRLCDIMDQIVRLTRRFQQSYFDNIKTETEEVLLSLNGFCKPLPNLNEMIKRCENKTLDPAAERRNQDIFDQWEQIQRTPMMRLRPIRTIGPRKRQDVGNIHQRLPIQNVKEIDMIGGFRSVMEETQHIEQDVTPIEADLKSIKTKGIEHIGHRVSKRN